MLKRIIAALRAFEAVAIAAFYGTPKSVESITAALAVQVQALRDLAVHHEKEQARLEDVADQANDAACHEANECARAVRIAAKINALIEG